MAITTRFGGKLDYSKLGKVKKAIVQRAYFNGYVSDMSYRREKESLRRNGWLISRCDEWGRITIGQYMLTDAGRAAYEQHRNAQTWQTLADADPTIKELLTPTSQPDLNAASGAGQHHNKGMLAQWAEAESQKQDTDITNHCPQCKDIDDAIKHIDILVTMLTDVARGDWQQYQYTSEDKGVVIDRIDNQITHHLNALSHLKHN